MSAINSNVMKYGTGVISVLALCWQIHLAEVKIITTITTAVATIHEHERRLTDIERRLYSNAEPTPYDKPKHIPHDFKQH